MLRDLKAQKVRHLFFISFTSGFPQYSILRIDSNNLFALYFETWPYLRKLKAVVILSKSGWQKEAEEP